MPLDEATELRSLDSILSSGDDPDTKRARIAALYEPPMADPSAGLPPEALAQAGPSGSGPRLEYVGGYVEPQVDELAAATMPGNANMVYRGPPANPVTEGTPLGAGGAGNEPQQMGGSGGTIGESGGGIEGAPGVYDPAAGGARVEQVTTAPVAPEATPVAPATAASQSAAQTVARPGGAAAPGGPAPWLTKYMQGPEGPGIEREPRTPLLTPFTPSERSAIGQLEGEQTGLTRDQAEAEAQAIQASARAELAAVERGQLVDAEMARRELERQQHIAEMEHGFEDMINESESEPIDSERLWNSKSTGEKILSKIALFIGTVGAGVAGQPNVVLQKMESDIDRSVADQKANKALKQSALAARGTLIDMARSRFQSEAAVDAAMKETGWRKVGAQLKAFNAMAQDPARKAAIEQLVNGTEARIIEAQRQRRLAMEADAVMRMQALAAARAPKRMTEKFVPLWGAEAPSNKEAAEARTKSSQYRQIFGLIGKLKTYSTTADPTQREAAAAAASQLALKMKAAEGPGAGLSSENDMKMITNGIANPTEVSLANSHKLLSELEGRVQNAENSDRASLGMAPSGPQLRRAE